MPLELMLVLKLMDQLNLIPLSVELQLALELNPNEASS